MRYYLLLFVLLVMGCKDEPADVTEAEAVKSEIKADKPNIKTKMDFSALPTDWVCLTEKNGELIIFNSCDGGNWLITVSEKNKTLLMHGTQEDINFTITGVQLLDNGITIHTAGMDDKSKQDFNFVWIDKSKGLARWITQFNNGNHFNFTFVDASHQKDFKEVNQPCKECWGDECDEMVDE